MHHLWFFSTAHGCHGKSLANVCASTFDEDVGCPEQLHRCPSSAAYGRLTTKHSTTAAERAKIRLQKGPNSLLSSFLEQSGLMHLIVGGNLSRWAGVLRLFDVVALKPHLRCIKLRSLAGFERTFCERKLARRALLSTRLQLRKGTFIQRLLLIYLQRIL